MNLESIKKRMKQIGTEYKHKESSDAEELGVRCSRMSSIGHKRNEKIYLYAF